MRMFRINPALPRLKRKFKGKGAKRRLKQALREGEQKARLNRSGLWDSTRAKSNLKVYRVGEEPAI